MINYSDNFPYTSGLSFANELASRFKAIKDTLNNGVASAPGVLKYCLAWNAATAYVAFDVVSSGGSKWIARTGSTNSAPVEGADWTALGGGGNGAPGPKGDKGDAGVAGPQGIQGVAGTNGQAGVAGPAGAKGDRGDVGPQGPSGADGAVGPQGPANGPVGPTGAAGAAGPQGPAGAKGDAGAQGIQGVKGDKGDQGIQGPAGTGGGGSGAGNSAVVINAAALASPYTLTAEQAAANTLVFTGTRSAALALASPIAGSFIVVNKTGQQIAFRANVNFVAAASIGNNETRLVVTDLVKVYSSAALTAGGMITTNLKYYLANGAGITASTWADQSGNGYAASLLNGATPGTIGGLNGVSFDGVNDTANVNNVFGVTSATVTMVARANFSSTSLKGALLSVGSGSGSANGWHIGVGSSNTNTAGNKLGVSANGSGFYMSTVSIGTGIHTLGLVAIGGQLKFYLDGALVYTTSGTAYAPTAITTVGSANGDYWFNGIVFDALVYSDAKSDADMLTIHQNL